MTSVTLTAGAQQIAREAGVLEKLTRLSQQELHRLDLNGDGQIDETELARALNWADSSQEGYINDNEWERLRNWLIGPAPVQWRNVPGEMSTIASQEFGTQETTHGMRRGVIIRINTLNAAKGSIRVQEELNRVQRSAANLAAQAMLSNIRLTQPPYSTLYFAFQGHRSGKLGVSHQRTIEMAFEQLDELLNRPENMELRDRLRQFNIQVTLGLCNSAVSSNDNSISGREGSPIEAALQVFRNRARSVEILTLNSFVQLGGTIMAAANSKSWAAVDATFYRIRVNLGGAPQIHRVNVPAGNFYNLVTGEWNLGSGAVVSYAGLWRSVSALPREPNEKNKFDR